MDMYYGVLRLIISVAIIFLEVFILFKDHFDNSIESGSTIFGFGIPAVIHFIPVILLTFFTGHIASSCTDNLSCTLISSAIFILIAVSLWYIGILLLFSEKARNQDPVVINPGMHLIWALCAFGGGVYLLFLPS
jgi:hypothetical protein